ncbi:hypothetical protein HYX10_06450 [Candidatus Woesearchaeota archaeon]|nr:hypothetical protein [Candidatus Woesearchaeota archaeon]
MADGNLAASKVLELVKQKGPVIPVQISVEIGTNSLLASALLSELVSNKSLKLSSLKVGGTPLYYAPGQEDKLQNYTKYLHDKEQKAYDFLKLKLVLRDRDLEPVVRVALRQIKDFAHPLNVQQGYDVELFWKWYLLSNEDAEPLIKDILEPDGKLSEVQKTIETEKVQKTIPVEAKQPVAVKKTAVAASADLMKTVMNFFSKSRIEVVDRLETKKKSAEFLISVPSAVGRVKYYCMVKEKKICNDADLSTAYVRGQAKNLPVLFLATGQLSKKASAMLGREFEKINFKRI